MKALKLTIRGKVQGVWFRKHTKQKADELDIKGFVRNEPDGSVYIEAEGDAHDLDVFVKWCERGPEQAQVTHMDVKEISAKDADEFRIER